MDQVEVVAAAQSKRERTPSLPKQDSPVTRCRGKTASSVRAADKPKEIRLSLINY